MYFYIISTNVAIYMAWHSFLISKKCLLKHFMLSKENLSYGRFHTILTHGFT